MKKQKVLKYILLLSLNLSAFSLVVFKLTERRPCLIGKIYGNSAYQIIIKSQRFIVGLVPFSLFELLLFASFIFIAFLFIKTIIQTIKKIKNKENKKFHKLISFLMVIVIIISLSFSSFIINGGLSYNDESLASKHGLVIEESTSQELEDLCLYLSKKASDARSKTRINLDGSIISNYSTFDLLDIAEDGYKAIEEDYPYLKGTYPLAKPAFSSTIMSYLNISGIFPYIIPEPLINYKVPNVSLMATICHEMAHQRGIAREDEANYIAYLACINNPNPLFEYSGYYLALNYSINTLWENDPDKAKDILENMDPLILKDRKEVRDFWKKYESPKDIVANISQKVNNSFLEKVNVEDGTQSYGRMVDLLLAARRKEIGGLGSFS